MNKTHKKKSFKSAKAHIPKDVEIAKAKLGRSERGKELQKLYHTKTWKTMRAKHLRKYPNCVVCGAFGNHCDHIKAHEGSLNLFYSASNIQTMCHSCHSKKTAKSDNKRSSTGDWVSKYE